MIELRRGDILKAKADALVNTVNTVGVMGRGIALQFSKAFPEVLRAYEAACRRGEVQIGKVLSYDLNRYAQPHWVINVPTKRHWRGKSQMEFVDAGLAALVEEVKRLGIKSVAIPPLGCGLGGLDWNEVQPRIVNAFAPLPDVEVFLYQPAGAPSAEVMAKEEKTPDMTEGRALLLALMRQYLAAIMDPTISLLEIHKLMYFMQEGGQPLKLAFAKGLYGPYAENLRHVLTHIEGHFIVGYGDASDNPNKAIEPKAEALANAAEFLQGHPMEHQRLDRVAKLIDGFETPYGMELLSTVHWVARREGAKDPDDATQKTYAWSERKRMFKPVHIRIAWESLDRNQWLVQTPGTSS
jgi:O-acetyl-ADP-ribose deacetylase (regulator of RNase III)